MMKQKISLKKKILLGILLVLVVIQFIRPAKNDGIADSPSDISQAVTVPAEIKNMLVISCYDCHSNHTEHRWYENIQPIGWWIGHHIKEGKEELNFSEFNTYSLKRKKHKLDEVAETVEKHEMPLSSYLWVHGDASLSAEQQKALIDWAKQSAAGLQKP